MPGRNFSSSNYRYGFNGKELDPESGTQDYGFRIYNPNLGKFLSVDPLSKKYPELTPYQFSSNTPIWATDLDGLEANIATLATIRVVSGTGKKGETLPNGTPPILQGDVAGSTYIVGNTVQPGNRGSTVIQVLNVEVSFVHGAPKNTVSLIANIQLPIVNSRPSSGTIYTDDLTAASVISGNEIMKASRQLSTFASAGLVPGEVLNSVTVDLSNVSALSGTQLNAFKANLRRTIRNQLNAAGLGNNIPVIFNMSGTKSPTSVDHYVVSYTSTLNTFSTANIPTELNNLNVGFSANFINSVMQTIASIFTGTPINTADPNVKTTNNPNDGK